MKAFLDNMQRAIDSLALALTNAPTPEIKDKIAAIDLKAILNEAIQKPVE